MAYNYVVLVTFISLTNGLPVEESRSKKGGSNVTSSTTGGSKDFLGDLLTAAAKHISHQDKYGSDNFGTDKDDEGFFKTHNTKSDDGYKKLGKFAKKDGDTYGFEEHSVFGKKGGGDKNKNLEYMHTSSYDIDDNKKKRGDESDKPAFREWHYESNSKSPSKNIKSVFTDDDSDDEAVDEDFKGQSSMNEGSGMSSKKIKRSKKPHPDVEITGNISGPRFQSLGDLSYAGLQRARQRGPAGGGGSRKTKREKKDPQISATDELNNYYDEGDDPEFAALEEGEGEAEGGEYDEYPEGEADDYY